MKIRIYRDVRFSKDKTPYKNNFGMGFTRATNRLRGGYYLQIEPGGSFAGGGFWQPNAPDLKRIRDEFAVDDQPIRQITVSEKTAAYLGWLKIPPSPPPKNLPLSLCAPANQLNLSH